MVYGKKFMNIVKSQYPNDNEILAEMLNGSAEVGEKLRIGYLQCTDEDERYAKFEVFREWCRIFVEYERFR